MRAQKAKEPGRRNVRANSGLARPLKHAYAARSSAYDALVVVKSAGRTLKRGTNLIVFQDDAGRFVTNWPVTDSDDELEFVVAATCAMAPDEVVGAFLVSVRTGEAPADRPDDERRWCALGELAEDAVTAHPELRYDPDRPRTHRSPRTRRRRR